MNEEYITKRAEETLNRNSDIKDWKPGFIGILTSQTILYEQLQETITENYKLRTMLWFMHECEGNTPYSGAHSHLSYMKCQSIEKHGRVVDFASDNIDELYDILILGRKMGVGE